MNHEHSVDSGHTDPITPDVVPDADHTLNGNTNGFTKPNGDLRRDPSSPAADSPTTPVSNSAAPDVKIDTEYQEQESDVRHEPMPIKPIASVDSKPAVTAIDDASTVAQIGTPADPGSSFLCPITAFSHQNFLGPYIAAIPVHPPNGTPPPQTGDLLEDVKMAEQPPITNGVHHDADVHMEDGDIHPPTSPATADASMAAIDASGVSPSRPFSRGDDEEHKPPPAKRARMLSDADQASFTHVNVSTLIFSVRRNGRANFYALLVLKSATPPPASAAPSPVPPPSATTATASIPPSSAPPPPSSSSTGPSTLTTAQLRFCQSTIRSLKKVKDAAPFLRPVDPVALNIPHYFSIIKQPMDFSTIERKLASSNPQKPDPNPENPRYNSADEFVADVRLIFYNCVTFNGPDHAITAMGKRIEEIFDKQIKHMPVAVPVPEVSSLLCTMTTC